jgi:hypothetical protein
MKWLTKVAAYTVLSGMPGGAALHGFLQIAAVCQRCNREELVAKEVFFVAQKR